MYGCRGSEVWCIDDVERRMRLKKEVFKFNLKHETEKKREN